MFGYRTEVFAIHCFRCEQVIFSRTANETRFCNCLAEKFWVEGGKAFFRMGGAKLGVHGEMLNIKTPKGVEVYDLVNDYLDGRDEYGSFPFNELVERGYENVE